MAKPKNHKEALIQGLVLAITAPTERQADMAMELVNGLATLVSDEDVAECQRVALELALEPSHR